MNILYLSSVNGGQDTNLQMLSRELISRGHKVSIAYMGSSEGFTNTKARTQGVSIYEEVIGNWHYYLNKTPLRVSGLAGILRSWEISQAVTRCLKKILSKEKIDLIETPEMFLARNATLGIPHIVRLHSADWTWRLMLGEKERLSDKWDRFLERVVLQRTAGISSPSHFLKKYITETCHLTKSVDQIHCPVDIAQFKPCDIKENPPMVLFVGRVEKRKGADILINSIPRILNEYPACQFIFIGTLCKDIDTTSVEKFSQVKFLGPIAHSDLASWYAKAAVFAAPSRWDNSPVTISESMACGIPAVATRVGGIPELIDDEKTGFLVRPNNALELAEKIIWLLKHPDERKQMGAAAHKKAIEKYDVKIIASQTLSFYQKTLSSR